LEAQLAKIPHTDIETNSVDDLLAQTHPVNIKSQDNNPANGIEVNSNVEANIERKSSIGSDTSNVDELIELDTSRDDIVVEETIFWKQHLALKIQDKNEILQNKKLTSYHMEAVNILLRKQFSINGLQLTEQVPAVAAKNKKRWVSKVPMESVIEPACQIHHTHRDHWVSTILFNNKIYFLDSLGIERSDDAIIPDGLKIQLSHIYGRDKKQICIELPEVMRQNNNVDCGLFAIAFITAFCFPKEICLDLIFDTTQMHQHLINCIDTGQMTEFPLTNKTISVRRQKHCKTIIIKNYCICNLPDCVEDMVQCDTCKEWFHKSCVSVPQDKSLDDYDFSCNVCIKST